MATDFQGLWLVNVYAPTGAERKQDREVFFNIDLPQLLLETPSMMLIGSDNNCVSVAITNKMQLGNGIYYSTVH